MDSDQITVEEIVSDSCLDLDPEEDSLLAGWIRWRSVTGYGPMSPNGSPLSVPVVLPTAYMPVEVTLSVITLLRHFRIGALKIQSS
ncbi:hypothetical protein DPMN_135441 [Dreissena polymorpha]|uniref:Uncharacterized protein n=1 Tax=Dreissena polymorpha TaxID=45954 RepID=A0A9D4JFT0_DREPO|nr:hypothetical protein DPMN_135441 [Dreissena polymorpha]